MKQQGKKINLKVTTTKAPGSLAPDSRMLLVIIALLSAAIYLPSVSYQLTFYDDATLLENIRKFINEKHSFIDLFFQSVFSSASVSNDQFYRPVLTLSLYMDTLIYGGSLTGFHITNVLLHAGSACLLYTFLIKLQFNSLPSFAASILFATHPALVQAVAWIPGRNDTLLTVFAVASLIFLLRYLESRNLLHLLLHLAFFLISLLTKETAVLLPVIYFLTSKIYYKELDQATIKNKITVKMPVFFTGWLTLFVFFLVIRTAVLGSSIGLPLRFTLENLFFNLPAIPQYIGKMMMPFALSTFPILKDTTYIFGVLSIGILLFLLFTSKHLRRSYLLLAISWLFLFLFPAILRTSPEYESVFLEHRMYFPMIGCMLLLAETDLIKNLQFEKKSTVIAVAAITIVFIYLNLGHSKHYKDEYSYWFKAVASSPNSSFAHKGLGTYYQASGKIPEAEQEYVTALQLNPALKEVRNNLGRLYLNAGQTEKAEKMFNEELRINPANAVTYYNLALLLLNKKNITEAEVLVRKSLSLDPEYRDAQNDLCVILAMQKKYDEAAQICIEILKQDPAYESARKNLKLIFDSWNDRERIRYYQGILQSMGISI